MPWRAARQAPTERPRGRSVRRAYGPRPRQSSGTHPRCELRTHKVSPRHLWHTPLRDACAWGDLKSLSVRGPGGARTQ
eukprot:4284751-Prymnesium_polylepis.1